MPETGERAQRRSLTEAEITARSGQRVTGDPEHGQEMFDAFCSGVPCTVVPTRMHLPGWYLRSRNGDDPHWNDRNPESLRALCAFGAITVHNGGPA